MAKEQLQKNEHIPYENEPENYSELRKQIQDLMVKVNQCKKETAKILSNDILAEEYSNDHVAIISDFNNVVLFLRKVHGFLLSDDVIQDKLK